MKKPKRFSIRNGLTFVYLRIVLSFIVFLLIINSWNDLALYLFTLTSLLAFFDGFLAKKNKINSQLRSILDPFADKLLVNLAAIALFFQGILPFWIMVVFLVKDASIILGAIVVLIKNIKTTFRSNVIDKVAVFFQIVALFSVLMGRLDYILVWVAVIFVIFSSLITLFKSGVVAVSRKTDLEDLQFRKLLKLPDLFTFFNILSGLIAILFAINNRHSLAVAALVLAVVFDYLDGKIARMIKREGEFGKQLDSLADTISFGVAPAVFAFSLVKTNFALIMFAIFLFAGVLRLARYNIMDFSGDYAGMPITVNGILIPFIYIVGVPVHLYPYIYLFLAVLMVSPVKFKKVF